MNEISDREMKIINLISGITKTIAIAYERLLFVDMIKEEKNSKMYNDIILNLKDLIEKENFLYKALDINFDNEEKLWKYFVESNRLKNLKIEDQFVDVCNNDSKSLWYYRVFNRFQDNLPDPYTYSLITEEETYEDDFYYDEDSFDDVTNYLDEDKFEELIECLSDDKLRDAINDDFQRAFVYFLGEEIKEIDNEYVKDNFTMVRYNILFVTPKIENELLNNNLQNKEDLYFVFPMNSDLLKIDNKHFKEIQKKEAISFCVEAIDNMLDLQARDQDDSEYFEMNTRLFSIYFRTGLSLIYNNTNYSGIVNEIISNAIIRDDEHNSINKIINMSLKNAKKDMEKCKYLSLYNEK